MDRIWGRVSRFSDVNTEVNCLTRALALLVSVAAGMPVGVCSVGMPWLSFRRDCMCPSHKALPHPGTRLCPLCDGDEVFAGAGLVK